MKAQRMTVVAEPSMPNALVAPAAPVAQHIIQWRRPGGASLPPLATTDPVERLIAADAVVAIGVSGGADSTCVALEVQRYLDRAGHRGPRLLVHADLGSIEWRDSHSICAELAEHLGLELLEVRRQRGGMVERWQQRWHDNLARYRDLSCVQLMMPWSSAKLRFCTSEMKTQIIQAALKRRFPGRDVLNVTGVRREESTARSKRPISAPNPALSVRGARALNWIPLALWQHGHVRTAIANAGLRLHPAYTEYASTRLSCTFCTLASLNDHRAAARCADNHPVYVSIVELEADSGFSFQEKRWLADLRPDLLSAQLRARVAQAKQLAQMRQAIEARIPPGLLFQDGYPSALPSREDAALLAAVRRDLGRTLHIDVGYTSADEVMDRFAALLAERDRRAAAKARRGKAPRPVTLFD